MTISEALALLEGSESRWLRISGLSASAYRIDEQRRQHVARVRRRRAETLEGMIVRLTEALLIAPAWRDRKVRPADARRQCERRLIARAERGLGMLDVRRGA